MPVIKSCLCFKDLLSACTASALYVIVMAVLELIGTIAYLSVSVNQSWDSSNLSTVRDIFLVLIQVILLVSGILLLEGTIRGYRGQTMLMVACHMLPIPILFEIGGGVYVMYLLISLAIQPNGTYIAVSVVVFIIGLLHLFFLIMSELSVVSLYQYLRKETLIANYMGKEPASLPQQVETVTTDEEPAMSSSYHSLDISEGTENFHFNGTAGVQY